MSPDEILSEAVRAHQGNDLARAEAMYRRVLAAQPGHPVGLHLLGVVCYQTGRTEEALGLAERAVAAAPERADFHMNRGVYLRQLGRPSDAIEAFEAALRIRPGYGQAHANIADVYRLVGRAEEAMASARAALAAGAGDEAYALHVLGSALYQMGRYDEAIESLGQSAQVRPDRGTLVSLGGALTAAGRCDEAAAVLREATRVDPGNAAAHNNLGIALSDMGLAAEAMGCFRAAVRAAPDYQPAWSNLLYSMHYDEREDARSIAAAHAEWARTVEGESQKVTVPPLPPHDPGRPLRVGYVSADFRRHSVGRFLLPILARHDTASVQAYCYSDVPAADDYTKRFRDGAAGWRDVAGMPDERVAAMVREDGIDVLVDLAVHTRGNRLAVFARRPAAVQVTYLGYPGTTGLGAVDFRVTDPYLEPEGEGSPWAERPLRLPRTYWCYEPLAESPEVGPPPCGTAGGVTFGCLNAPAKLSPGALVTWAEILRRVPGSRLILHAPEGGARGAFLRPFVAAGVDPGRVEFMGRQATPAYLATFGRIDVGLDPFPYNGGTTTCDALWIGVPVVTLAGRHAVARAGASILSNAGLPDLVAQSREEYVGIAVGLASDRARLAALRASLRERARASPLMDMTGFVREFEAAIRAAWVWALGNGGGATR